MALSVNTSLTFNYASNAAAQAAGYVLFNSADLSWTGAGVRLAGTSETASAVRTPQLDTAAWVAINGTFTTQTDAVGYRHRFLVSFDDWSTEGIKYYATFVGGEWLSIASNRLAATDLINACKNGGMTRNDLAIIREWPDVGAGSKLSFLVSMDRDSGGGTGLFDAFAVYYGTEVLSFSPITASGDDLPQEPDMQTVTVSPETYSAEMMYEMDYKQSMEVATAARFKFALTWSNLIQADADDLINFLLDHRENASFTWTPRGYAASKECVCVGTPQWKNAGVPGLYVLSANIEEAMA